jgi:hypothetical protein
MDKKEIKRLIGVYADKHRTLTNIASLGLSNDELLKKDLEMYVFDLIKEEVPPELRDVYTAYYYLRRGNY